MLTIGEVAAFLGVSTRTVRFYQSRGLLPEPPRDASGYRRYDADAVIRLQRAVTLAAAGVPLARVGELLDGHPSAFRRGIETVAADLDAEIERLVLLRERLDRLGSADRVALPDLPAEVIEELRANGAPETYADLWRDSWILAYALYPEVMARWDETSGMLGDPAYRALLLRTLVLADADPDDPRVAELAEDSLDWLEAHPDTFDPALTEAFGDPRANAMMTAQWRDTPAWERLTELTLRGIAERGLAGPPGA